MVQRSRNSPLAAVCLRKGNELGDGSNETTRHVGHERKTGMAIRPMLAPTSITVVPGRTSRVTRAAISGS